MKTTEHGSRFSLPGEFSEFQFSPALATEHTPDVYQDRATVPGIFGPDDYIEDIVDPPQARHRDDWGDPGEYRAAIQPGGKRTDLEQTRDIEPQRQAGAGGGGDVPPTDTKEYGGYPGDDDDEQPHEPLEEPGQQPYESGSDTRAYNTEADQLPRTGGPGERTGHIPQTDAERASLGGRSGYGGRESIDLDSWNRARQPDVRDAVTEDLTDTLEAVQQRLASEAARQEIMEGSMLEEVIDQPPEQTEEKPEPQEIPEAVSDSLTAVTAETPRVLPVIPNLRLAAPNIQPMPESPEPAPRIRSAGWKDFVQSDPDTGGAAETPSMAGHSGLSEVHEAVESVPVDPSTLPLIPPQAVEGLQYAEQLPEIRDASAYAEPLDTTRRGSEGEAGAVERAIAEQLIDGGAKFHVDPIAASLLREPGQTAAERQEAMDQYGSARYDQPATAQGMEIGTAYERQVGAAPQLGETGMRGAYALPEEGSDEDLRRSEAFKAFGAFGHPGVASGELPEEQTDARPWDDLVPPVPGSSAQFDTDQGPPPSEQ